MSKSKPTRAVSQKALLARINRRLAPDLRAHRHRQSIGWVKRGTFFVVGNNSKTIFDLGVDLEVLGVKVGALGAHERLAGVSPHRSLVAPELAQNLRTRADQAERARRRKAA